MLPASGYVYTDDGMAESHGYLVPRLQSIVSRCVPAGAQLFEVGFGNGSVTKAMCDVGYQGSGIEPSDQGYARARHAFRI